MSFDGIVTRAVVHELSHLLTHGRITKIYQPSSFELVLRIRSQMVNHTLLLSIHPTYPCLYITHQNTNNPPHPPLFCMVLRKHIDGGIVESIEQVGTERIVHLNVRVRDELGDEVIRRIVIEIMGRHSNIILIDPATNQIVDAQQHVHHHMSRVRQILPGITYQAPPDQNKIDPFDIDKQSFIAGFDYNQGKLDAQIVRRFRGIGPQLAKEIITRANIHGKLGCRDSLWEAFSFFIERFRHHHYEPTLSLQNGKQIFTLWKTPTGTSFASISEALESFFDRNIENDRVQQQAHDLIRRIKQAIVRHENKIERLTEELSSEEETEKLRVYGELLTAHLHQVKRGAISFEASNFYDPEGKSITIPLDPSRSPSENAQRFFKKYQKLKAAKKWNMEQIEKAQHDNLYLESVLVQLTQGTTADIGPIREELEEEGWLKKKREKKDRTKKRKQSPPAAPITIHSSEGIPILVGRNNKQNDHLTHRLSSSTDTWLHAQHIPGSHVVIRSRNFGEDTLQEAAMLAAYYSRARDSSRVPVDYTEIKHVKKPSGSRPGFVIYDHQRTLYVTPDEDVVSRLLNPSTS